MFTKTRNKLRERMARRSTTVANLARLATLVMIGGPAMAVGLAIATASPAQVNVCPGASAGGVGDAVDVAILIDNPQGIDAFGLDFVFDPQMLEYESTRPSMLTADWLALNGSENASGTVTIGGFHTTPISISTPDTLCILTLTVLEATPTSYTLTHFVDDLAGTPDCSEGLTAVEPGTWGRVKAVYREQ